ncbi:hypothetical protein M2263_001946 [Providencia alcalifaciens]|nr:hypothetical protein [Providencia alcalifaciens]
MKDNSTWKSHQYFDFLLSHNRFMRGNINRYTDGSFGAGLSEIVVISEPMPPVLMGRIPCEIDSGAYEAFIQLIGAVQWKSGKAGFMLDSVFAKGTDNFISIDSLSHLLAQLTPGVCVSEN